jgi:hypothetical protein
MRWPFTREDPGPEPTCEVTGLHKYEGRYDTEPLFVPTADDFVKFGQINVDAIKASVENGKFVYLSHDGIIQTMKASMKSTYLGDMCPSCGRFVRHERR